MVNLVIGLIFLILIVGIIFVFKILLDRADQQDTKEFNIKEKKIPGKQLPVQDFIDVKDIKRGIVIGLANHHSVIIRVGSVNYYLMSQSERSVVINGLLGLANSITFPIQIYTTTELIDTMDAVKTLKGYYLDLPVSLQNYSAYMADSLLALRYNQSLMAKHSYIIIPYDSRDSFEKVFAELTRRSTIIISSLNQSGIKGSILNTEEAISFLHGVMNREDTLKGADAVREGGFDLYVG